jgi:hypothetical protein
MENANSVATSTSRNIFDVVDFLNDLISIDAQAICDLIELRVPCKFENHPTTQVSLIDFEHKVGLLGILNGIFGGNNIVLCACYDACIIQEFFAAKMVDGRYEKLVRDNLEQ